MFKKFFILFSLLILSSCVARNLSKKGYIFDNDDVKNISVGLTSKENVIREIGYPLNKSYFNENVWIYYSYKIKEVLFFKPKLMDQKVLVMEFDPETNILKNMSLYEVNSDKFKMLEDKSMNPEEDNNIIHDLLRNIGTIKPM